jgi:hypothetical protein
LELRGERFSPNSGVVHMAFDLSWKKILAIQPHLNEETEFFAERFGFALT